MLRYNPQELRRIIGKEHFKELFVKLFGIAALLAVLVASIGCQSTPVTFAPYAGYGGYADGLHRGDFNGGNNTWQVGIGASFTLGGSREYVTPVPGHPSLPAAPAQINNNTSATASQVQGQAQGQAQIQDHVHND